MSRFQTTRWSLVAIAREQPPRARDALEQLCRTYRPPVLAYLRRSGMNPDDAEDMAQAFFVQFLEHALYASADPQRGRFRTLLLTALQRFVSHQRQRQSAQKRGAALTAGNALDDIVDESASPEAAFTQAWLLTVLSHAMNHLQCEWEGAGKHAQFEQMWPLLEHASPDELQALAAATGIRSNTLAVQVHRMRKRLRELIRGELLLTVGNPAVLEQELQELHAVASAPGNRQAVLS